MSNNCLSVLYKHIIQVEYKNVGLKVCVCVCVCVGGAPTYHCPPIRKVGGRHMPPYPPPPASYASAIYISYAISINKCVECAIK